MLTQNTYFEKFTNSSLFVVQERATCRAYRISWRRFCRRRLQWRHLADQHRRRATVLPPTDTFTRRS